MNRLVSKRTRVQMDSIVKIGSEVKAHEREKLLYNPDHSWPNRCLERWYNGSVNLLGTRLGSVLEFKRRLSSPQAGLERYFAARSLCVRVVHLGWLLFKLFSYNVL